MRASPQGGGFQAGSSLSPSPVLDHMVWSYSVISLMSGKESKGKVIAYNILGISWDPLTEMFSMPGSRGLVNSLCLLGRSIVTPTRVTS